MLDVCIRSEWLSALHNSNWSILFELSAATAVLDQSITICLLNWSIFKMYAQINNSNSKMLLKNSACPWHIMSLLKALLLIFLRFHWKERDQISRCIICPSGYSINLNPCHVKQIRLREVSMHVFWYTSQSNTWLAYFVYSEKAGFWLTDKKSFINQHKKPKLE